ncbi:MAG: hypothetical protein K2W99_01350 [Chthoniobacterales bacterium]|nr:hypothetical protein [Chthoniobacterales bacterium]
MTHTPQAFENNFETKSLQNIIHPNCEIQVKMEEIATKELKEKGTLFF